MYKHYIEIDANNNVTRCFSDVFFNPDSNAIEIRETEERHFYIEIDGEKKYNPKILEFDTEQIIYLYKYVGGVISEKTEEEKYTAEINTAISGAQLLKDLNATDDDIIRGIDDLIDILIAKGTITENDLPVALKDKWDNRKILRGQL